MHIHNILMCYSNTLVSNIRDYTVITCYIHVYSYFICDLGTVQLLVRGGGIVF